MLEITLSNNKIYQFLFRFPDKRKPVNKQVYTQAKLSVKIINPENSEDYAWETIDEVQAKVNNKYHVTKKGKLILPDKFTKYGGRKACFGKLVNNNFDDKETRRYLWKQFLNKYGFDYKVVIHHFPEDVD